MKKILPPAGGRQNLRKPMPDTPATLASHPGVPLESPNETTENGPFSIF
jgi:hypothetical protein